MGKVDRRRSALGNHVRQAQQADLILHGWQATGTGGAINEAHGYVFKDAHGLASVWSLDIGRFSDPGNRPEMVEWDELSTVRVFWLHKAIKARGWI